ncbi:putative cadherin-23, partial [Apostichopus japonicus]
VLFTDVDLEGTHMFSLSSGGQFRIDPATGEIFTSVILDREEQSFYQLMVTISDGVSMATAPVNITIIDINDNNPVFGLDEYSAVISEDFPLFTMILTINASDADLSAGDITFRFESNRNVEGPFTLDLTTGLLEISTPLDRELQSMYTLRVVAMDSLMGGVQRNSTVTINIDVTDVNDNGPQFTQNPYPGQSVPEDIEAGVPIIQVSTTDEDTDENAGVVYQIIQGNVGDVFEIDGEGIISRGSVPLDRETLDFYLLVVEASDPSNPELPRDTAVVTIEVTDVNDVIPEFSQPFYSRLDLVEDASIETVVVDVQAQDMDLGLGEIRYAIIEGNQMGLFRIDPLTGIISIVSELPSISDTLTFNLTVQAQDQESPFNAGIAFVIVNVIDAGEIPPEFVLSRYEVDSIENLQTGTFVVQVLALVENRPADVRYILDPNSHPDVMMHFQVNDTTGEITVRVPLDRETNDFFAFTVIAAGETVSSSTAVWVTVLDANDNTPIFLEFPEDVRIPEDSPTQTVIGEIRTTDLDINQNAQINYVISDGNREGAFTFRRNSDGTASIITTRPLNREFTDEYNITVTAFDGGVPRLESSQTIRIVLTDTNDNAPLFTVSSYSFEIIENQLSSLPVATLNVTDNDLPSTNNLVFTIVQGNEEDKFEINNQGDIFLTSPLDRETLDSFQLTVLLEDPTFDPQYQGFVSVFVTVLDENDNAPAFDKPSFQAQVEEGVRSAIVTTVEASDRDLGVNREIRFNVTGPNSEFFSIDPIQGHLMTVIELDRETLDEYIVTITAIDQAIDPSARLTSTTTVTIAVTDINDSRPTFLFEQYGPYFILEESPNAFIDSIQAVDPDLGSGGRVTYSVTGQFREYFLINSATGLLTVNPNRPLDYERQQQINITIVASDTEGLESTTDITVNVLNVNDNTPRFEGAPYAVTISENVNVGTLAFIAGATDADLGLPGVVTYDIIDGNIDDVFWINPLNGEIYVNETLDRETTPSYRLTLEAKDNPENPEDTRTTTTTLSIEISDADDVPPTFPNDEYFGTILENSFAGTLVDMDRPIRAVDSDEVSVIVYNITGEDSEVFSIDRLTGELRSGEVFDHEVKSSYTFTVIATDSQGSYAQAAVIVTVLDANDNEPLLDLSVYNFTIPENSAGGVVVGQLTASDGDGDMVRFSIVTGGGDRFLIDAETGEITVSPRAILDRERQASYMLTISVSDQGAPQLTSLGMVNIDLSDINDSPPVFVETESIVSVSESEQGQSINFFRADDPDLNALVIYLIDSVTILDPNGRDISAEIDSSGWFRLNQTSGELILVEQVDREAVSEINVVISARDENGVDPETRTSNPNAEVQILITDINDNAPVIEPISVKTLQEESSIGTIITTVVADDLDQGEGGRITYIIEDSQNVPVMIDPDTGVLTVGSVIDREDISWVNFTVLAIDNGAPSLNSTVDINLRITDINDNNPSFNQTLSFMVNESSAAQECFGVVLAQDPDAGDFGAVTYELSGGDGLFFINTETGEICLSGELDKESVSQYSLIITAKDNPAGSANNRRETSTRVVIDVTDTNEFAPRSDLEFPFDLPEGEPPGTVVGKITALDPDTPDDPLIYLISDTQPSGFYNSSVKKGQVKMGELIRDQPDDRGDYPIGEIDSDNSSFSDQYRINIIISDGGIPEQTTNVVSVITILDINDSPPSFDESLYNVSVSEDFDTTNPVVTVSASDPDEQSVLTYIIVDGNEDLYSGFHDCRMFFSK